jgi:NADH-quinone oxidoreductase subunit A
VLGKESPVQFGLANILFFIAVGTAIPLLLLTVGKLLRPAVPEKDKLEIYECGEVPLEKAWFNFNPRFYIVALVFLIFDVEVAFTWPVAAVFKRYVALGQGALAFGELFVFIAILLLGLAYVWKHGDLEWIRRTRATVIAKEPREPTEMNRGASRS